MRGAGGGGVGGVGGKGKGRKGEGRGEGRIFGTAKQLVKFTVYHIGTCTHLASFPVLHHSYRRLLYE